jgi:hypothetical protein
VVVAGTKLPLILPLPSRLRLVLLLLMCALAALVLLLPPPMPPPSWCLVVACPVLLARGGRGWCEWFDLTGLGKRGGVGALGHTDHMDTRECSASSSSLISISHLLFGSGGTSRGRPPFVVLIVGRLLAISICSSPKAPQANRSNLCGGLALCVCGSDLLMRGTLGGGVERGRCRMMAAGRSLDAQQQQRESSGGTFNFLGNRRTDNRIDRREFVRGLLCVERRPMLMVIGWATTGARALL